MRLYHERKSLLQQEARSSKLGTAAPPTHGSDSDMMTQFAVSETEEAKVGELLKAQGSLNAPFTMSQHLEAYREG